LLKLEQVSKHYRINQYIQANEVRVIDERGKQIGVLPIFNAIQEARKLGVDLVEVAASAKPPVCKLINFKKFLFQEAKKERESKKAQKGGGLKEIRFTPFIAQNDFNTRIKRLKEFLLEGNKVRVVVRFTGRQLGHREFGQQVINRVVEALSESARKDSESKWLGKDIFVTLTPATKKIKDEKQKQN